MKMDVATQTDAVEYQCLRCRNNFQSHTKSKQKLSKCKKNHNTLHSSTLTKSRSASTSSLNSDSDLGAGKPNSIVQKQTYQPPILNETSCPTTYHAFWKLKAQTRRLPPNQTKISKYVAPRFSLTM